MNTKENIKTPKFIEALILSVILILILLVSVIVFDMDIQLALFICVIVASLYSVYLGFKWNDIEVMMLDGITSIIIASLILLLIGIVIATWIASGTIPYIIYVGLKLISPKFFLLSACLTCSFMSMATGSSWSSAGTVGIAFMGIGAGLGVNPAMTAGAIVSGSFFGDKQSPFSNTTNLAAALSGTSLFEHTSSMLWTTTPALIISLIFYTILGFTTSTTSLDGGVVDLYLTSLEANFHLTPLLLIPIAILIVVMIRKSPPIPGLVFSSFIGAIGAVIFQKETFSNIGLYMFDGYIIDTGVEQIDRLLNGGGLYSMLWTLSFYFLACVLGEILDQSGVLAVLLEKLKSLTKTSKSLITSTIVSGIALNAFTGAIESAFLITAKLFAPAYDELNLDRKVLSRALEDGGTMPAPIIPWNANGVYMAATLGVATVRYAPYAFLCYITPIVGIIFAYAGIGTFYIKSKESKKSESPKASQNATVQ